MRRVLLCSGKVAFDAMARRDALLGAEQGLPDPGVDPAAVAVVRVEQLYPWPEDALAAVLGRYPDADEVVWVQEEPENMGAWSFAHGRLHRLLRDRFTLTPREPGRVGQPGHRERGPAPARAGGPAAPGPSPEPSAPSTAGLA